MAKSKEKLLAQRLRQKGLSILEISKKLSVSKGTVSLWCRNIELTEKQREKLYSHMVKSGHKGRLLGALVNKNRRLHTIQSAKDSAAQNIPTITKRELFFLGLGLYWGEGSKSGQGRYIFVNSDPYTIKIIMRWLEETMKIDRALFSPQVYINNVHKYRIDTVMSFWSKTLGISKSQFGNPIYINAKHKKIYANHNTYMGVLHLAVKRSSTLMYETMALLERIREAI
jgi:transcriptional regulator with XRE-family HTH domain